MPNSIVTANNMVTSQMSNVISTSDTASVPVDEQQTLDLVHRLLQTFQDGQSGIVFACGGTVPIPPPNNTAQQSSATSDGPTACQPVILRWDPCSKSIPASECKLQFPLDHSDSTTVHNMQQLLHDMQPATFGYQGQNILDESYRKASKLDPSSFACTFSPHELGIVDEVARILLPGFKDQATSTNKPFCEPDSEKVECVNVMRAELYKLNVYTGPSGHFKAHVDTPRSTKQIGSLVVCLPCVHEGGQLEVRHKGRTMTFDWSMPEAARPEIQWAAFYSDCEHEVLEVTSGHRITLTYNLYASPSTDPPKVGNGLIDPTQLPLYNTLQTLFLQENFMPDGGYLGVHTSHAYPHTSTSARLPSTLKGADVVVWETFRSLGCGVRLRPVVELPGWAHYGHDDRAFCPAADLTDTSSEGFHSHTDDEALSNPPSMSGHEEPHPDEADPSNLDYRHVRLGPLEVVSRALPSASGHSATDSRDVPVLEAEEDDNLPIAEGSQILESDSERWKIDADEVQALQEECKEFQSLPKTDFQGLEPACLLLPRAEDDEDEEATTAKFEQIGLLRDRCRALGNGPSFHADLSLVEYNSEVGQLLDHWMEKKPYRNERTAEQPTRVLYEEVAWLNHSGIPKEPQISYAIYGNEAEAAVMYSTCGIVAQVPPYTTRKTLLGKV